MRELDLDAALRRNGGVLSWRSDPELRSLIRAGRRAGLLRPVLPGVFVHRDEVWSPLLAARAVRTWRPDAVIVGPAAAALTFWPELRVSAVEVAIRARPRCRRGGYRFVERRVPPELVGVAQGVRVSVPALTALDLVESVGGDGIDRALRARVTTLAALHLAMDLTGGRRGNLDRRAMLLDSRDRPWSAAERRAHRLLRAAGVGGWHGNVEITLDGHSFFLDIGFDDRPLAIEIDGREFHGEESENFEADRWRQNLLVLHGWTVLRFTWRMLVEEPEKVIAQIREAYENVGSMASVGVR